MRLHYITLCLAAVLCTVIATVLAFLGPALSLAAPVMDGIVWGALLVSALCGIALLAIEQHSTDHAIET